MVRAFPRLFKCRVIEMIVVVRIVVGSNDIVVVLVYRGSYRVVIISPVFLYGSILKYSLPTHLFYGRVWEAGEGYTAALCGYLECLPG